MTKKIADPRMAAKRRMVLSISTPAGTHGFKKNVVKQNCALRKEPVPSEAEGMGHTLFRKVREALARRLEQKGKTIIRVRR
jgi:hypothetical protein